VKKSNNNIKAVLFDVDETLFDRVLAQQAVLELIVKQLPLVFSGHDPQQVLAAFLESDRVTTEVFNSGALPKVHGTGGVNCFCSCSASMKNTPLK
jgi:hypothetical protein